MEYYWSNSHGSSSSSSSTTTNSTSSVRWHHGSSFSTHAWDSWDLPPPPPPAAASSRPPAQWTSSSFHHPPVMMLHDQHQMRRHSASSSHLTCLKLGKRQYFEERAPTKKGKSAAAADAVVPTCQVEGCEAVLLKAKDYHRRHKVCEMHAKASKVLLLGIEQRFCQQCSRFHEVSEFDEAKRSCRRRLAGHNERRRKGSQAEHNNSINAIARKHYQDIKMMGRQPHPHVVNVNVNDDNECALSLLSSTNYAPWNSFAPSSSPDLPARRSAALRELIAENRQLISNANNLQTENYKMQGPEHHRAAAGHVTLNLMQAPGSPFGLLSGHDHSSTEDDGHGDCSDLWKLPMGY